MVKKYSKWFTEQFPDFTEPNDSDLQEYSEKLRELRNKELEQELELKEKKWQFQSLGNIVRLQLIYMLYKVHISLVCL